MPTALRGHVWSACPRKAVGMAPRTLGPQQFAQDRARLIARVARQALLGFPQQLLPLIAVDPGPANEQVGLPAGLLRRRLPGGVRGAQVGRRFHVAPRPSGWDFHWIFLCTLASGVA